MGALKIIDTWDEKLAARPRLSLLKPHIGPSHFQRPKTSRSSLRLVPELLRENGDISGAPVSDGRFRFVDPTGEVLQPIWLVGIGDTYLDDSIIPSVVDFIVLASAAGIDFNVVSAFRTTLQQGALGSDSTAITPATAGNSLHEAGLAIDINCNALTPDQQDQVVSIAASLGLQWGGDFSSPDVVHFYQDTDDRTDAIAAAQAEYLQLLGQTGSCQ